MEIRSSRLFKQQVADLFYYLKITYGLQVASRVRDEIEEKIFLLKSFPNMGAIELLLEGELSTYRFLVIKHNKIIYTVEDEYIFIHLLWDCRQDPCRLEDSIKDIY